MPQTLRAKALAYCECGCGRPLPARRRSTRRFATLNCQPSRHAQRARPSSREYHMRRKYGIGEGEFEALFALQDHACAICRSVEPGGRHGQWHVDHEHASGTVRGILCMRCNIGIGTLEEDPERLEAAATYLRGAACHG